jgi:hypothetical protein
MINIEVSLYIIVRALLSVCLSHPVPPKPRRLRKNGKDKIFSPWRNHVGKTVYFAATYCMASSQSQRISPLFLKLENHLEGDNSGKVTTMSM